VSASSAATVIATECGGGTTCVIDPPTFAVTNGAVPDADGKYAPGTTVEVTVTPGAVTGCDSCTETPGVIWRDSAGSFTTTDLVKTFVLEDLECKNMYFTGKTTLCADESKSSFPRFALETPCHYLPAPFIEPSAGSFTGGDAYPPAVGGGWYAGVLEMNIDGYTGPGAGKAAATLEFYIPQNLIDAMPDCPVPGGTLEVYVLPEDGAGAFKYSVNIDAKGVYQSSITLYNAHTKGDTARYVTNTVSGSVGLCGHFSPVTTFDIKWV